ncbi:patatin-like protein 3 [Sesbania bispinosa]|nr:patatin-like protein 3 [Sesbania bispinosa]
MVDTRSNANIIGSGRGRPVDATAAIAPPANSRLKYPVHKKHVVIMASGVPATISVSGASVVTSAMGVSAAGGRACPLPPRP